MIPHPHLNFPIRLYPDSVGAWRLLRATARVSAARNRGGKFSIDNNIDNRHATPLTPSSLNSVPRLRPDRRRGFAPWHIKALRSSARFTETERSRAAFTLIELMAATTVLSVILLMMVGMQDQMSKAWSNSNRRTDATREARAACRLMSQDLTCLGW